MTDIRIHIADTIDEYSGLTYVNIQIAGVDIHKIEHEPDLSTFSQAEYCFLKIWEELQEGFDVAETLTSVKPKATKAKPKLRLVVSNDNNKDKRS